MYTMYQDELCKVDDAFGKALSVLIFGARLDTSILHTYFVSRYSVFFPSPYCVFVVYIYEIKFCLKCSSNKSR